MPVRYEWADDQKVIMHLTIESPWTWQEYNAVVDELMPMIESLGYPCATVVNTENMGPLPKDGNALQNLLRVDKMMPDNLIASAIIGTPMIIQVFMNMLTRLRPHAARISLFVESTEEAHERIHERLRELKSEPAE
jgi:hypothetical protein